MANEKLNFEEIEFTDAPPANANREARSRINRFQAKHYGGLSLAAYNRF